MSIAVKLEMIPKEELLRFIESYIVEQHYKYEKNKYFEHVVYNALTELKRRIEDDL